MDLTKTGLDFFHELFDYPYPWGKYDSAFVPEYNLGAMENPGLVTFTEGYVFTSRATEGQHETRANTIMHEMAHMWFGDLVTMSWWDDLWLKESFADYIGTLANDEATEFSTAWITFANRRKGWAYVADQLPTTHPIVADITDLEAAKQNFDGITYAKGASVLKQLAAYVGADAFRDASRKYFRVHDYANTTLAELLGALSAASGRDLAEWARQWLQTSGISALSSEIVEHGDTLSSVTLLQDAVDPATGRQEPRPHRLRIGLYDFDDAGALVRTDSVETDLSGARTEVTGLAGKPRPALLLVNDDDLSYAKVRLDPHSEATVRNSLDKLRDPMARALCWTALWDSARDAVTPAALYIDAVQRFGPAETGIGVLLNVLGNASTAVERYVARGQRDAVRRGFLTAAAEQLRAAAPGSDQQLAWARTLAATSRYDASQLDLLRGILDGSTVIGGLAVDAELRWNFWHALAAHGQASPEQLDQELAGDNTAAGKSGHATALAARPLGVRQGFGLGGRGPRHGAVQPAPERHHRRIQHGRGIAARRIHRILISSALSRSGRTGASRSPAGLSAVSIPRDRTSTAMAERPRPTPYWYAPTTGFRPIPRTPRVPCGASSSNSAAICTVPQCPGALGAGSRTIDCSVTALLTAENGSYGASGVRSTRWG